MAADLRAAIQEGNTNLKDRLHIKMENDTRFGEVRFDNHLLYGKVLDLPTIIESLKTIDNKNFYKTADICHMVSTPGNIQYNLNYYLSYFAPLQMICKFEPEVQQPEEDCLDKKKKKDPLKVDKKYLWPHGVTPPCKNVRKRRFRKTLKKKYVEAPEIEKEVKRLLKIDNDAVHVKYEIINENEEGKPQEPTGGSWQGPGGSGKDSRSLRDSDGVSNVNDMNEHEIFGALSSSDDDEERNANILDDDNSLSGDDSRSNYMMMKNKSREGMSSTRDYDRDDSQDGDYHVRINWRSFGIENATRHWNFIFRVLVTHWRLASMTCDNCSSTSRGNRRRRNRKFLEFRTKR